MTEEWTDADDHAVWADSLTPTEPLFAGGMFLDLSLHEDPLAEGLTTPEARHSWREFGHYVRSIPDATWGSYPVAAEGAPDVCYVKLFANERVRTVTDADSPTPVGFLTLVWRPEAGIWLVHAAGARLAPEDCPRTSPGIAPDYTRAP